MGSLRFLRGGLIMVVGVVIVLFVSVHAASGQAIPEFEDVPEGHVAESAIRWAAEKGITAGVGNNRFGVGQTLTRYEMVTFLCRAFNSGDCRRGPAGSDWFVDVPLDHWANFSVGWAVSHGITSGVSATEFGGSQTLTREQMITFLYRAQGSPTGGPEGSDVYEDVPGGRSSWANLPIGWAFEQGVTGGIAAGMFGFGTNLSREEMVLFLCRALATDVCPPSQDPLSSSVVPTTTLVDIPRVYPGVEQRSLDAWSCLMYGSSLGTTAYYQLFCRGDSEEVPVGRPYVATMSVGATMGCAIRTVSSYSVDYLPRWYGVGPLFCWGSDVIPVDTDSSSEFFDVAVGSGHVCAIRYGDSPSLPRGDLECWGGNYEVTPFPGGKYVDVTVGASHTCAIREVEFDGAGYLECWGDNTHGQLEDPVGFFDEVHSRFDLDYTCARDIYRATWECWGKGNPVPKLQ